MDRIKIIATLKWVHDILRELHFTDVLEDIDDCIMMLKKEQQASTLRDELGKPEQEKPEWQELYKDEIKEILNDGEEWSSLEFAQAVSDLLREKNHG